MLSQQDTMVFGIIDGMFIDGISIVTSKEYKVGDKRKVGYNGYMPGQFGVEIHDEKMRKKKIKL